MLESFQDPKLQRKIDRGDMLNLSDCEMVEEKGGVGEAVLHSSLVGVIN